MMVLKRGWGVMLVVGLVMVVGMEMANRGRFRAFFKEMWGLRKRMGEGGRRDAVVLSWFIGGHEWL